MTSKEITKGFDEIRQLLRQTGEESKQRSEAADRRSQEFDQRLQDMVEAADRRSQKFDQRLQDMVEAADRRSQNLTDGYRIWLKQLSGDIKKLASCFKR